MDVKSHDNWEKVLTRALNKARSFWVSVSALAITGIKLTRVPKRFMISMSKGFNLKKDGWPNILDT